MLATRPEPVRSWPDVVPADNRTLGWQALEWTAEFLNQPDGPAAGRPWEYTTEQVKIVLRWYEIDDLGRFIHRRGVLRRMKGWGKSPFLASLAAVELCGPCRFAGWDANKMPVAKPHAAPWIQIAAVNQEQTKNTMTVFPSLFSATCATEYNLDIGKLQVYARKGAARIECVTSSPRALEGGRPSWVIADETQHWVLATEGPKMMEAISRNLAKSRDGSARVMEITNAHLVAEDSVAEATYESWRQSKGNLEGVYYDATEAPRIVDEAGELVPIHELTDEQIRDGLLAARGDSTWLDVDRLLAEIRDPNTSQSVTRRFYFNQVTEGVNEEWLPAGAWDALKVPNAHIPDGADVILAVDGSYNDDSTGIVVASMPKRTEGDEPADPIFVDVVWCWEPDAALAKLEQQTVPIEEAEDEIRNACRKWRVRELAFDPYRWARTMQVLQKEGLPVVEFPNSPERMITATQRFQTAVMNGTIAHNGDIRLARHVGNAVVREDRRGRRIVKETKWSPRKIDLAVAAVMAHDRAADRPAGSGAAWLVSMRDRIAKQRGAVAERRHRRFRMESRNPKPRSPRLRHRATSYSAPARRRDVRRRASTAGIPPTVTASFVTNAGRSDAHHPPARPAPGPGRRAQGH